MAFLGKKQLATLGFLAGLLVGCGGGGDGGTSSSGNVNPTDTTSTTGGAGNGGGTSTTTSSLNVSQVFANAFTIAATYNLSGTSSDGSTFQMSVKVEPEADESFQGRMVKKARVTQSGTVNGVSSPVLSEAMLFENNPFIIVRDFRIFTGTITTPPQNGSTTSSEKFISAPALMVVGNSGELGQTSTTITSTTSKTVFNTQYRYSVEVGTDTGTAWLCLAKVDSQNGVPYAESRQCFLTNTSSQILGMKVESKEFDAAGNVTSQMSLR